MHCKNEYALSNQKNCGNRFEGILLKGTYHAKSTFLALNKTILLDVNNTGPETLPVSVCNCFLYFTYKELTLKD